MNTLQQNLRDGQALNGVITFTNFLLACERAREIDCILRDARNIPAAVYHTLIAELRSLSRVRELQVNNRVLLAGRAAQAARLAGSTTYTGIVNYGALGTGSTAVADADVDLAVEVARKALGTVSNTNDISVFDFYYSKSDTNGTYQEFGVVIDGTATLNSGLLFNRALTGGWVKSATESMTVSLQININAA